MGKLLSELEEKAIDVARCFESDLICRLLWGIEATGAASLLKEIQ